MRYFVWIFLLISLVGRAQQKGLNYQAVILDPNPIEIPGQVVSGQAYSNGKVWVRFTLVSSNGIDYEEIQQTQSDAHGLVNLMIGTGQSTFGLSSPLASGKGMHGQFDQIDWGGDLKRLRVALSFTGLGDYVEVSNQWLSFSPYALYAAAVDYTNVRDAPRKLGDFTNDVGYLIPRDLDPISKQLGTLEVENKQQAAQIASDQSHLVLVDQRIQDLGGRVDTHEKDLSTARLSIASVSSSLSDHEQRIVNQGSQANYLQSQVAGLQNQVLASQSILASLNTAYESVSNKSNALDLGNIQPSSSLYPTQLAVKSYVDLQLSQAISTGAPDATTLAKGKVQLAGDLGGTASSPQISRLQGRVIQASNPSAGQVLRFNGTAWVPDVVLNSEVQTLTLSGAVLTISGTNSSVTLPSVADASTSQNGLIRLAGDLGGTASVPVILDNVISSSKIVDGAVTDTKFSGVLSVAKGGTGSALQNFVDVSTVQSIGGAKTFTQDLVVGANKFSVSANTGNTVVAGSLSAGGLSYPVVTGSSGEVLTSNGSGGVSWAAIPAQGFSGTLAVGNGGTGSTSLTGLVKGNGTASMTAAVVNTDYSLVRLVSDEFTVSSAGQTSFTLSQTPNVNSVVRLFINGVRISKNAISISGRTVTYNAANNGSATLVLNDRIQMDYYY